MPNALLCQYLSQQIPPPPSTQGRIHSIFSHCISPHMYLLKHPRLSQEATLTLENISTRLLTELGRLTER